MAVFTASQVGVVGKVDGQWWRVASAPFFYENLWYAVAVMLAIGLYGGLLEQRHGPLVVVALFCVCGMGGIAVAAVVETIPLALGANGAALGMLAAWAVRPALELRRGGEPDVDLIGTSVVAVVLLLMPFAATEASPTAGAAGLLLGALAGVMLARR